MFENPYQGPTQDQCRVPRCDATTPHRVVAASSLKSCARGDTVICRCLVHLASKDTLLHKIQLPEEATVHLATQSNHPKEHMCTSPQSSTLRHRVQEGLGCMSPRALSRVVSRVQNLIRSGVLSGTALRVRNPILKPILPGSSWDVLFVVRPWICRR